MVARAILGCFVSVLVASPAVSGGVPTVTFLPTNTRAYDVSDDGSVVVGVQVFTPFRWTESSGVVALSGAVFSDQSNVPIARDGSAIGADVIDANGKMHAARTETGTSWTELPTIGPSCDAFLLNLYDMNADGSVMVGLGWVTGCQAHAFRWDPINGTVDMGTTVPDRSSRANAVSADGSLIVGWQDQLSGQRRGAKWVDLVQSYFPQYTSPAGGHFQVGEAIGVSASGAFVVGYNVFGLSGGGAWKWSAASNETSLLPQLPGFGGQSAIATGVTDDGSVAVGTTGGFIIGRRAIIWIDGVASDLKTYVESLGGSTAPYTTLGTAMAITPDGRTIVGWGAGVSGEPGGWIVTLPGPDCPADLDGDGAIGASDLAILLGAWATTGPGDLDGDGLVGPSDLALLLGGWGTCR